MNYTIHPACRGAKSPHGTNFAALASLPCKPLPKGASHMTPVRAESWGYRREPCRSCPATNAATSIHNTGNAVRSRRPSARNAFRFGLTRLMLSGFEPWPTVTLEVARRGCWNKQERIRHIAIAPDGDKSNQPRIGSRGWRGTVSCQAHLS